MKNYDYIFSDPNSPKETVKYDYQQVKEMWRPNEAINVTGYIYIIFEGDNRLEHCPYCQNEYPILTKNGISFSTTVICPYCDRGKLITEEQ